MRGRWWHAFAPIPARIGAKGFSDNHTEGVPTTPTGVYSIGPTMYGIAATNPGGNSEALWQEVPAYTHFAEHPLPRAVPADRHPGPR
ncbi:hypothetical protein [Micromonospora sp. 15K316]|uniref:hypothetical protein n=1 Tax=Micromonospora sp. 15K316 TaxID=2530376 RepID=UPI001FB7BFEB|nr:hypothetical protein [Micromonospora sp. 15K316]